MLFTFQKIDLGETDRTDEQYLLMLCLGIIKNNLNSIFKDCLEYAKIDVRFDWGGCGPDTCVIYLKDNPHLGFVLGCDAEVGIGGTFYDENKWDVVGEYESSMGKTKFTLPELNSYLIQLVRELVIQNKIAELYDAISQPEEKKKV